jgi:Fur family transcriptional regulator, ferric uptake regulator
LRIIRKRKLLMTENNVRLTGSRRLILDALKKARGRHLSAEDLSDIIRRQGADIHLATVYRALQYFAARGLVKRSSLWENHAHYEMADSRGVHLLCDRCGRIREMDIARADALFGQVKKGLRGTFKVKNWQLQLVGTCGHCAGKR